MTQRPIDTAALILTDPHGRKLALIQHEDGLRVPQTRPMRGDGALPGPTPRISRRRLGAQEARAAVFIDAAIRGLFDQTGLLIARPAVMTSPLPGSNPWSRLQRHRLMPDRDALTYLGRALDPADAAPRRHVRVFGAALARVANSVTRRAPDGLVWLSPESAAERLPDQALLPFIDAALGAVGGRPNPIMVSFRAGQCRQVRL